MGKFTGDSKKLLEYVGGRENIAAVSHCVTRMRFVLNESVQSGYRGHRKPVLCQGYIHTGRAVPGHNRQ